MATMSDEDLVLCDALNLYGPRREIKANAQSLEAFDRETRLAAITKARTFGTWSVKERKLLDQMFDHYSPRTPTPEEEHPSKVRAQKDKYDDEI